MKENPIVTACQIRPVFAREDVPKTVARWVEKAVTERGAQMIVFPEAINGYPTGAFGDPVGVVSNNSRELYGRLLTDSAVDMGDPNDKTIYRLSAIAAKNKVLLTIGLMTQRDRRNLQCSMVYLSPKGEVLGQHIKTQPTAAEMVMWARGENLEPTVVNSPWGRIGGLICNENYLPAARLQVYREDIDIYVAPTLNDRENWISLLRTIAYEGQCFVVSANQYATRRDYPPDYDKYRSPDDNRGTDPTTVFNRGGTVIIDPLGNIVAGPIYDQADMVTAKLNLDLIPGRGLDGYTIYDSDRRRARLSA